jgi:hypothetical protein
MKTPRERSCTVTCWTATEPECRCICSGAMHGKDSVARREFIQKALGRIPRTLSEWNLAQPRLQAIARRYTGTDSPRILLGMVVNRLGA